MKMGMKRMRPTAMMRMEVETATHTLKFDTKCGSFVGRSVLITDFRNGHLRALRGDCHWGAAACSLRLTRFTVYGSNMSCCNFQD